MKREIGDFVEDIVNAMNYAIQFVESISYECQWGLCLFF